MRKNFGVGCPGGVEVVAHTLRDFVNNHTGEGLAALKVDFRNAFNCVETAPVFFLQFTSLSQVCMTG